MATITTSTNSTEIDDDALKRIISAAVFNLEKLKQMEGGAFPKRDRDALVAAINLQMMHRSLL